MSTDPKCVTVIFTLKVNLSNRCEIDNQASQLLVQLCICVIKPEQQAGGGDWPQKDGGSRPLVSLKSVILRHLLFISSKSIVLVTCQCLSISQSKSVSGKVAPLLRTMTYLWTAVAFLVSHLPLQLLCCGKYGIGNS